MRKQRFFVTQENELFKFIDYLKEHKYLVLYQELPRHIIKRPKELMIYRYAKSNNYQNQTKQAA